MPRIPANAATRDGPRRGGRPRRPAAADALHERVSRQADRYAAARRQNASEVAEDYVELIDDLIREEGEARSVALAERLGVSHVTVAKTVRRLQKGGLVHARPYRSVFLTDEGRRLADDCRRRHTLVVDFLKAIGVRADTAERDAEGIEHHVSGETLAAMEAFIRRAGAPRARTR